MPRHGDDSVVAIVDDRIDSRGTLLPRPKRPLLTSTDPFLVRRMRAAIEDMRTFGDPIANGRIVSHHPRRRQGATRRQIDLHGEARQVVMLRRHRVEFRNVFGPCQVDFTVVTEE
jgi:hypothetical protein